MSAAWVSAHLFHFGDLDSLLRGAVAPVVGELTAAGTITGQFYLRYWEGGLHVRLRLRPSGPGQIAPIRRAVSAAVHGYFARHPSTAPLDQAAYRAHASAFAHAEGRDQYDQRLRPADAVEFITYHREHHAYGDAACLEVVERHFVEASALALPVVAAGTPPARRAALGLAAVTVALAEGEPDLGEAAARFAETARRSGWRAESRGGDETYRRRREDVLRQTRQLWTDADRGAGGALARWRRSVQALRGGLEPLWAAGQCLPENPGSPLAYLAMSIPPRRRTVPLILLRCAHLFCNRIGLDASTEVETSRLLARALTDLADQREMT